MIFLFGHWKRFQFWKKKFFVQYFTEQLLVNLLKTLLLGCRRKAFSNRFYVPGYHCKKLGNPYDTTNTLNEPKWAKFSTPWLKDFVIFSCKKQIRFYTNSDQCFISIPTWKLEKTFLRVSGGIEKKHLSKVG